MCHQVLVEDTKKRQEERGREVERKMEEVATLER